MLDWQSYDQIADTFKVKAKYQDRQDLKGDIVTRLAEIANRNGKTLSKPSMLRIASYVVMSYWRDLMRLPTLNVTSETVEDSEGHETELYQMLADDNAIDLDNWIDCRIWLRGCPRRLVRIAYKKAIGKALNSNDQRYLNRYQEQELKKAQKTLF